MPFSFRNIIVPVDFTINSEVAINKALEIADSEGATIHLLHVLNHLLFQLNPTRARKLSRSTNWTDPGEAKKMLEQWKDSITDAVPHVKVHSWILSQASVRHAIVEKTKELGADLIVIGKKSNHHVFPFLNKVLPGELAQLTGCAVLTVKPGSLHSKIRTVVVPVTDPLPQHKMEAIAALCKKYKVKVYLATFINDRSDPEASSTSPLLQMYQWLKGSLHCPVEYAVLQGYNKAKAILNYAEKVNADILLVHPQSETKISWRNSHISDALPAKSKMQVLTVQTS
jgi:nucleotide-binding universal stress UspA family protein